jgi:DNA polymerase-3 subunit alpha
MIGNRLIYQGKSAIRDLSQVYDIPSVESQKASKEYNNERSVDENIYASENISNFFDTYPFLKEKVEKLVGTVSSLGIHAGGVVISDSARGYNLNRMCALQRPAEDGRIATLWTKKEAEQIGLIKYDILGLSAASIIHYTKKLIGMNPYEDCLEDEEVFKDIIFNSKHKNIFQFESPLGKKAFEDFSPMNIMELANASGIIRVVGSEAGREIYDTYKKNIHAYQEGNEDEWRDNLREQIFEDKNYEIVEKVLEESYGVMIYQEQLSYLVKEFSDGEKNFVDGNKVRKLLDKLGDKGSIAEKQGNPEALKAWHDEFMEIIGEYLLPYIGRDGWGNPNKDVQNFLNFKLTKEDTLPIPKSGIISWFISAAAYLFSKLHSISYSINSYNMMHLKHYYPLEFWTASLISDQSDAEKIKNYISAIKLEEKNIKILSPCVNSSDYNFSYFSEGEDQYIRYGLNGMVGFNKAAEVIINERLSNGEFKSIKNFIKRVKSRTITKKTYQTLFYVGAFDCFGSTEEIYDALVAEDKLDNEIDLEEETFLLMEDKFLGVNIKYQHPLLESAHFYTNLLEIEDTGRAQVACKILKIYMKTTRTNKPYYMLKIQCLNSHEVSNIFVWDVSMVGHLKLKEGKICILNIKRQNDFLQLAMGKG